MTRRWWSCNLDTVKNSTDLVSSHPPPPRPWGLHLQLAVRDGHVGHYFHYLQGLVRLQYSVHGRRDARQTNQFLEIFVLPPLPEENLAPSKNVGGCRKAFNITIDSIQHLPPIKKGLMKKYCDQNFLLMPSFSLLYIFYLSM